MADEILKEQQAKIFPLVVQVSECLQINPQEAQQLLERLLYILPRTINSLENNVRELEEKQRRLEDEGEAIRRDSDSLQQAQNSLKSNIDFLNTSKYNLQSSLDTANRDLSRAESDKCRAEKEKDDKVAGTVAGGVGAVVLGIFFPPSLALTVPAVAAGGAQAIRSANREIDRCRNEISSINRSISEKEQQIREANSKIATNKSSIEELELRKQQLHVELGKVKNRSVFMLRAKKYFKQLLVAVEAGQNQTDLVHKFVQMANQEEQYIIHNNEGMRIVARSFAAAWEEVEIVMNNDEEEFMNIDFVEVPHLQ